MIVLGTMRLPSLNFGQLLRCSLSRHSIVRHIPYVFGSSKVNYYSTSQAHHQYDARRVASSHPFFYRFPSYMDKTAVIDQHGSWKYRDILQASCKLAEELVDKYGQEEKQNGLNRARIGLLCDCDASLYIGMFAGWLADAVVVRLHHQEENPLENLYHSIENTGCSIVMTTETYLYDLTSWTLLKGIQIHLVETKDFINQADEKFQFSTTFGGPEERFLIDLPFNKNIDKDAIIQYVREGVHTILGKNGVVLTFRNIMSNVQCDIIRRDWNDNDTVLFTNHLRWDRRGSANLFLPLYFGATCLILPEYSPEKVLEELLTGRGSMAASNSHPVIKFYCTLEVFENILNIVDKDVSGKTKNLLRTACDTRVKVVYIGQGFYLPQRWFRTLGCQIWVCLETPFSGDFLIFRPKIQKLVHKFDFNLNGFIKPTVMGRIAVYHKEGFDIVYECIGDRVLKSTPSVHGVEGELQLKGDCVAAKFLNNSDEMKKYFYTHDGWLKTGFIARASMDRTITVLPRHLFHWLDKRDDGRPFKISSTLIFSILRKHPAVKELEVFRRPNAKQKQSVAVAVTLKNGTSLTLKEVYEYMDEHGKNFSWEQRRHRQIYPSLLLRLESMPLYERGNDHQILMNIILREDLHEKYDIETIDS